MPKTQVKWKIPKQDTRQKSLVTRYPQWFLDILKARGLESSDEIGAYLNPSYDEMADYKDFSNIGAAVERIVKAKEAGERVTIYGDYDVDGVTATAVMYEVLNKIGVQNVETYIPHREEEGYGLNLEALKGIKKGGTSLIVAVDCGITSGELIDSFSELDFIVVDHHTIDEAKLPKKAVLLHPSLTQKGEEYQLSAAGMGFVFALALQQRFIDLYLPGQEKWLLDLVALSTICDIVPLRGTNRLLAYFGLMVLGKTKREGLLALLEVSGAEASSVDTYTAGFVLGPRLNAAGRLENAQKALKLLLTKDKKEARQLAVELNRLNSERQLLCERIVDEARQQVEAGDGEGAIHLLSDKDWPRGVVGIVASRVSDYYNRPAIIFEDDGEFHHGSARSVDGLNITELLSEVSDYVVKFGGHAKAAGLTVSHEHFVLFKERLTGLVGEKLRDVELNRELVIDTEIGLAEIKEEAMELLARLEPTGFGNKRPTLMIRKATAQEVKRVGKGKEHLKFTIHGPEGKDQSLQAVAFNEPRELEEGKEYDFALTLKYNIWNNRKSIEARILDFREAE